MSRLRTFGAQYASHLRHRLEGFETTLDSTVRRRGAGPPGSSGAARARVAGARRMAAQARRRMLVLLESVPRVEEGAWPTVRRALDDAWTDYREAVERLRMEVERARPW